MEIFNVRNKKITVMGLGLLGRGLGDVKFLAREGAEVTVTDLKSPRQLAKSLAKIKKLPVELVLGKHRKKDFKDKDFILKAAGVPLKSPYIKYAKENKVAIKMDDSWFAQYCPCPIIGITGTRGKTTTTLLINELLKSTKKKVYLSGNAVASATLPLIKKVKKDDLVVLELSSWQLQGWAEEKLSPHIAVITNIFRDHLNYYKTMEAYINDKKAIYKCQSADDYLILNKDNPYSKIFAKEARSKIIWFSDKDIPESWNLKILGRHNLANAAAAIKVAELFRIKNQEIRKIVENFVGAPNRLELAREFKGIKYYNDTTATTPDATIAALKSFNRPVVLLAGGTDKNLEFGKLAEEIKKRVKALILFEGTATSKLAKELRKIKFSRPLIYVDSMPEAFRQAKYILDKGDIFLLSPGAASFGLFVNEFDRGQQFKKQVFKIK